MKKPIYKRWWFWVVAPFGLLIIIAMFRPLYDPEGYKADMEKRKVEDSLDAASQSNEQITEKEKTPQQLLQEEKDETKLEIQKSIDILLQGDIFSQTFPTKEDIGVARSVIKEWQEKIRSINDYYDPDIIKLKEKLIKEVSKAFSDVFPKLRRDYAELVKDAMWEHDIDVKASGSKYNTITFIGSIFATNKSKKDFQDTQSELLYDLRFTRVNYKWYKYDDEYTYYTLTVPKDSDIE